MAMAPRTKMVLGYIGIAVSAALIAAGLIWALMSTRIEEEAERADSALERVTDLESKVDSLTTAMDADVPDAADSSTLVTATTSAAEIDAPNVDAPADGRQFCFFKGGTWEGETPLLQVDYAQMLSGDEAAAAATAHGSESPPPNGYYIVNDNPKVRELPADKAMTVSVVSQEQGVVTEGYGMPFGQWYDVLIGMSGGNYVKDRPYWITIEDGKIVAISEQFLP